MKSIALFIAAFAASASGFMSAQAQTPSTLNISKPNGYATTVANDFNHKTVLGAVRWTRVWDGYEWKFNPHWESLSTSWGNLTGSQSANTTVGDIPVSAGTTLTGVDKPPANLLYSSVSSTTGSSSSGGGSGGGCWAWVDEDWQPTYTSVMFFDPEDPAVTMEREAGPMIPLRSTPFNRGIQGEAGAAANTDYVAAKSVSIDYATLCPGGSDSGSSAVQEKEALRRSNELYVGTDGRYSFNNRSVLEKRAVKQLATAATATQYANISTGQLAASILSSPVANAKGYRWIDKSGDWTDYNTQGQVVAFGDKNNNIIWLLRDTDGLLIAVVDGNPASAGKVLYSLHYSGQLLTQVKDYSGTASTSNDQPNRSISYQYDDKNRLTQVTDARGGITVYTYDKRNRIIKITDPENRIEKFGYIGDTTRRRTAPDGGISDYFFEYDDVNKQFTSKIQGPETAAGRTSEIYTHNRVGKLVGQTLNGRAELHIKYDTGNRSEVRTNARGFGTRLTKNEFEQLVQVDQADGTSSSKTYSALHLGLTQETDELGIITQYQYDTKGNLTQKKQAAGTVDERITNYIVNSQGQATSITRKGRTETSTTGGTATVTPDAIWQLEYDSVGHVKKTIDPEGNTRQYAYDRDGNLRKYTDPRGNSTSYEVDAFGNLTKSTDALGRVQTYQYDRVGNLTQVTDARAKVTQAAYDAMNRSTKIVNAVGGQFQVQYNAKGMPILFTDEDGRTTQAESDNYYHFTKVTDGAGNTTQASSQIADGTATGMLGALNSAVEVAYPTFTLKNRFDQLERPTSQTLVNTSSQAPQAAQSLTNTTSYDKRGQIKSETNASGNTYAYTYNALGQRLTTTDTIAGTTTFSYDARGNLLQLTDAKGNAHRFEYDRNNRITKETLPLGQSTSYTYDSAGNLVKKVDPLGNTFTSSFDAANRLTEIKQSKAGDILVRTSTPTWDSNNNLVGWSDTDHTRPTGQQTTTAVSTFDNANRKTSETISYPNPQGSDTTLTYSYQYSLSGKKTQLTWADGTKIDYSYSAHGELQSTALAGEGSMSVSQYKWLAPEKVTLPGGHTQGKSYDGLLNLEALKVKTAGQQTVLDLQNSYGKEQELTQSKRTDTAANISTSKTSTYVYDTETRLTQAKTDTGGLFGTDTQTFTLDSLANRTAHSRTSGAWTYDANNRLTQRGTGTCGTGNNNSSTTCYQYDDAGNLTQKTEANKVTQYSYDTQNRLTEVADITVGQTVIQRKSIAQYGYDPLGRRIWKEQYRDANAVSLAQAKRTIYLYADEGLIAEATQNIAVATDASGVQTVTASAGTTGNPAITTQYGPTPNSPFGTGALFVKTKNSNNTDTVAYYHHDHLQTPIQATDKAGNIVWVASYDAFGKASIITPAATADKPTIESNLRLPGQYEDHETGLHYNYFRYYDTQTGRYISQDPIGLAGGVNRFAYVNGNPMNLFDPMGLAVYGDNGNNFGDIPPTEGCRTPIWAGGFIMGWKPCNPPKPPTPRPPSTPSPFGGSCEGDDDRDNRRPTSPPASTPSIPNTGSGNDPYGGIGASATASAFPFFGVFGCTTTVGAAFSPESGGLSSYAGCGVGLGGIGIRNAGQASYNWGDPHGWGARFNASAAAFGNAGSVSVYVNSSGGVNVTVGAGQGGGGTVNLTYGYRR